MEYEQLVEMIAHIKAAQDVVGLETMGGRIGEIMDELHQAQNDLNYMRLEALGNGRERPYNVHDLLRPV